MKTSRNLSTITTIIVTWRCLITFTAHPLSLSSIHKTLSLQADTTFKRTVGELWVGSCHMGTIGSPWYALFQSLQAALLTIWQRYWLCVFTTPIEPVPFRRCSKRNRFSHRKSPTVKPFIAWRYSSLDWSSSWSGSAGHLVLVTIFQMNRTAVAFTLRPPRAFSRILLEVVSTKSSGAHQVRYSYSCSINLWISIVVYLTWSRISPTRFSVASWVFYTVADHRWLPSHGLTHSRLVEAQDWKQVDFTVGDQMFIQNPEDWLLM